MAACSLPVQSQCYLLNSSPVSTIDRYEICEQKLRAYLGNAADYTRLTITDDMCTMTIYVIILIFRNLTFSRNMVTCLQCEPVVYGKMAIKKYSGI